MRKFKIITYALMTSLLLGVTAASGIMVHSQDVTQLYNFYSDNMLFQQNKSINVSGTAPSGHEITVKMQNGSATVDEKSVTVGSDQKWTVALDAQVGGYTEYSIQVLDNSLAVKTLNGVVVGELWLSSGQSNMQLTMYQVSEVQNVIQNPENGNIRFLLMPEYPYGGSSNAGQPYDPQTNINGAYWGKANNETDLSKLSAVSYYYAASLQKEINMPVGILSTALGSTSIYTWLSREAIDSNSGVKTYLQQTGRYIPQSSWNQAGYQNFYQMSSMYNQKISPLTALNIAGLIWYQGEDNSGEASGHYHDALNLLLKSYSAKFGFLNDSMPLIFSHLAPQYYDNRSLLVNATFAEEMSQMCQEHPENVAQISNYDVPLNYGEGAGAYPIHPLHKKPVGERMAKAALGLVYDETEESTSPVYKSMTTQDSDIFVTFAHVGDGLAAKTSSVSGYTPDPAQTDLIGFTICGADGKYVEAKAEIVSNDTVRVWAPTVRYPVSVTYAFSAMNMSSNLVSTKDGETLFAAVPFRTANLSGAAYYYPHDWTTCDLSKIWHSDFFNANFYDAWKKGTGTFGAAISYQTNTKTAGNAALKVDFNTDNSKSFRISPVTIDPRPVNVTTPKFGGQHPFVDTNANYSNYQTLSFDIKNTTGRSINLGGMLIEGSDGTWYRPYVLGGSSFVKEIPSSASWQTVTLDLTKLNKITGTIEQTFTSSVLQNVGRIEFLFYDSSASSGSTGTIFVDNFLFGFKPDKAEVNKQGLMTSIQSAKAIDTSLYTAATVTTLTSKLNVAQSAFNNINATQTSVDTAAQELTATISSLVLKQQ